MKKIFSLAVLTLVPFITLLGGCGPGNETVYTGAVTTYAGMAGASGVANAITTGTDARFNFPSGITTDGISLYITDSDSHTIRKITISASGVPVTTLAGMAGTSGSADGTGAAARFFNPSGITTDGTYLYVADTFNHNIRRIEIDTGTVTTLAGMGTPGQADGTGAGASFKTPMGIVLSGGNLYVADTGNHAIRKVTTLFGDVTTIAGTAGSNGFADNAVGLLALLDQPSGIATDGISLYVTDTGNHAIRKVDIAASNVPVTTIAGDPPPGPTPGLIDNAGTNARFNSPVGVVWSGGKLYVADRDNHAIRQVEILNLNNVTTLAGAYPTPASGVADGTGADARFKNPSGITTDGISLYVTDTGNHTIRKIQ